MSLTFAFCSDIREYHNNGILDRSLCPNFPGSEWVPEFADIVAGQGHRLVTGDVALEAIRSGSLAAGDVRVISEQDAAQADQLLKLGAVGAALVCFESPLFSRKFYEKVPQLAQHYEVRVLFAGTIERFFKGEAGFYPTRIPIFRREQFTVPPVPWAQRRAVVGMVAGNKYWRTPFAPKFLLKPKKLEAWLRGKLRVSRSGVKHMAVKDQLHDARLELIEAFGQAGMLELHGGGWLDPVRIPRMWRKRIFPLLQRLAPGRCDDKQQVLSQCRFGFAIENNRYPGYVTEKIVDCIAAGTVPLYLGDPLITQTVPQEAFLNIDDFASPAALLEALRSIDEVQAQAIIDAGQRFLHSPQADEFTFKGFAEKMAQRLGLG